MNARILTVLIFVVNIIGYSQSLDLKKISDSLSAIDDFKQKKINQFQSVRANSGLPSSDLMVDVKNGHPLYRAPLNANAAITTGASKLQSGILGFNLTGKGFTIGVWDDGKVKEHIELDNRIISSENAAVQNHATHVAGTLIASGVNPNAKGMAPQATVADWYFDNDEAEIAAQARSDQSTLLFSNHSYGQIAGWYVSNNAWVWAGDPAISADEDFYFGFYGDRAKALDQIVSLAPYSTIVWAAGNDRGEPGNGTHPPDCNKGTGYDCIIPDAVGKNIITVGAVNRVLNYTNAASVSMSSFSSWGPTDDGRIKPDLVGDGVDLYSLSADGVNTYAFSSGTSMATPNVTGSLVLLQELYSRIHGGNKMRASTLKAVAIHSAKEAGAFPGPDYRFGWGLLDAEAAAKIVLQEDGLTTTIQELTLINGEKKEWTLTPKANQKITATITWTDPAGKPVADALDPTDLMLVNDLDIKITDDAGNEFLPWILDPGIPSQGATRGNNFRDNVEKVELDLPQLKNYKLTVNHKKQLSGGKQDFSLVLTYQSINTTAQTYYWVGDTGTWSDPTHWSMNSGGVTSNKVPGAGDNVIIDENSFDGVGLNQINFSQDQSIGSLIWLCTKASGMSLNTHKINIGKLISIGTENFQWYSRGNVQCNSSTGNLNFLNSDLALMDININGGNWVLYGNLNLNKLSVIEGALEVKSAQLKMMDLVVNSTKNKTFNLVNSEIELTHGSEINSLLLTLNSVDNSKIKVKSDPVTFNWQGVKWPGSLVIEQGNAIINGDNFFKRIELSGKAAFTGTNELDSVLIIALSDVLFSSGKTQTINNMRISNGVSASLHSPAASSIVFTNHTKYCFDNLAISNVEAKGNAVVNAGINSTLVNASGWLKQNCADVLFSDFTVKYPCENGLTQFTDRSSGTPQQWSWIFPGAVTAQSRQAYFPFAAAGTYPVTLTVSNGSASNSFTGSVMIGTNTLQDNEVVVNGDELFSFNQSLTYQWLKNEIQIPSQTSRSYAYNGQEGVYSVLTFNNECNRISNRVTITGIEANSLTPKIYPNPADEEITIDSNGESVSANLIDLFGRVLLSVKSDSPAVQLPVTNLTEGVYLIEVVISKKRYRERVIINHNKR